MDLCYEGTFSLSAKILAKIPPGQCKTLTTRCGAGLGMESKLLLRHCATGTVLMLKQDSHYDNMIL